jgi:ATP-dependent RNA helicase RhlE
MTSFRESEIRGIVTTDVMARGLDISDISQVINVEFPEIPEQYIHRIGRTGRADKSGIAISLISPREEEIMIEAEVLMEKEIDFLEMPDGIEIAERLLEFEKDKKKKMKFLIKKPKLEGGASFHEKIAKNKKVNLGGPSKTKKKTSSSVNRNILKARAAKKKKK